MQKPNVFLPNTGGGHDFSAAKSYGNLIPVTENTVNAYNTGVMLRAWRSALRSSGPDDWIVVTSLNSLCMIGAALFALKHRRLNLLLFSNRGYQPRKIILDKEDTK